MVQQIISDVITGMTAFLNNEQLLLLRNTLSRVLSGVSVQPFDAKTQTAELCTNAELIASFLAAKRIEGCSERTIQYYHATLQKAVTQLDKTVYHVTTEDLRSYLSHHQQTGKVSKVSIDNIRRVLSSFFAWLEDEDYILKSPVRRIHKVRSPQTVKETYSDEMLETLRDNCDTLRDLAMIDLLASTGIRVGELVHLNRADIDFAGRECIVFGKGSKERPVYFDARTKIHLQKYLDSRTDDHPALFVTLQRPYSRLQISGVEIRLRTLGRRLEVARVHPHKFRRTLATRAIDKGMPIEQVQKLLGHAKIDTTMQYAMVDQTNVKMAHRKFLT